MSADDDGAVRVVDDVIARASHDRATHSTQTSRPHHNHDSFLLVGSVANHLARLATKQRQNLARDLNEKQSLILNLFGQPIRWNRLYSTLLERIMSAYFFSNCFACSLLSSTMRSYKSTDGTSENPPKKRLR